MHFFRPTDSRRNFSLVARYSLKFTRCSLLIAKFARYSLQKLLVAKIHLLLVAEIARCKKSLVPRCKIRLLLVAEVASKNLFVVKNYSFLIPKFARFLLHKDTKKSQLNLVMEEKI